MRILGVALSGAKLPFISAQAKHHAGKCTGVVVCETQEQCDAIAEWAKREAWDITTRIATDEEVAAFEYWKGRE